jgi:UDP-glucose 4-epimerase
MLKIDYTFIGERTGDIVHSIADVTKIKESIGFAPSKTVQEIINLMQNKLD